MSTSLLPSKFQSITKFDKTHLHSTCCTLSASRRKEYSDIRGVMQKNFAEKRGRDDLNGCKKESADGSDKRDEDVAITEWNPIFKYPHIISAHIFCRAKIFQTGFTLILSSGTIYSYIFGSGTLDFLLNATLVSGVTCATLLIFGNIIRRIVGFVYINPDKTRVKISHLDFWGRRRDVICKIEDLTMVDDYNHQKDYYFALYHLKRPGEYYYISLKSGGILDKESFVDVFNVQLNVPDK